MTVGDQQFPFVGIGGMIFGQWWNFIVKKVPNNIAMPIERGNMQHSPTKIINTRIQ
jgi:hypothetical protein